MIQQGTNYILLTKYRCWVNLSVFRLSDAEKERQEKESLLNIGDSFKKIIIVKDVMNVQHDQDEITTMSIYDFLLNENSLEM